MGSGGAGAGGAQAQAGGCGSCSAARQTPAVTAVVDALDKHAHAMQPGESSALESQQQPPKHLLVPQSALEVQASPGELRRQEPKGGVHIAQPRVFAAALQQ